MNNDIENFKKRLIYRSQYRGTKEMDKLIGSFVQSNINKFNNTQLKELEKFLLKSSDKKQNSINKNSKEFSKFIEKEKSKFNIQRFKGLGEMNPEELWQTTLDPENRLLLQVQYSNSTKAKSKKDQDLIQVLMGDEVAPRKDFIINRALEVSNLDI